MGGMMGSWMEVETNGRNDEIMDGGETNGRNDGIMDEVEANERNDGIMEGS
jgi:hypothetical protein